MNKIYIQNFETEYGELVLGAYDNKIVMCDWLSRDKRSSIDARLKRYLKSEFIQQDHLLLKNLRSQLDGYFLSKRKNFDLPIYFVGTDFQKKVWTALNAIPYGETVSYLQLAIKIKKQKSVRALANANAANALSIIVPCHRVIGSNGGLGGYAGGMSTKKQLIQLEQNISV